MGDFLRYVIAAVAILVCGMVVHPGAGVPGMERPAQRVSGGMSAEGNGTDTAAVVVAGMYASPPAAPSPSVSVMPAVTNITEQQSLAVTVEVVGEPGDPEPTGTVALNADGFEVSAALGAGGQAMLTIPGGVLPTGTVVLHASYTPDTASASYYAAASGQAEVLVYPSPAYFLIAATGVTLSRGATTGNTVQVKVQPYRGFTGRVILTAAITGTPKIVHDLPRLSFGSTNPVNITGDSAGVAVLTVTTTGNVNVLAKGDPGIPLSPGGGAMLAGLLVLTFPAWRKKWRQHRAMRVLYVAAVAVFSLGLMGCGFQGGFGAWQGTTPGKYTVKITGVGEGVSATGQLVVTVR